MKSTNAEIYPCIFVFICFDYFDILNCLICFYEILINLPHNRFNILRINCPPNLYFIISNKIFIRYE